MVDTRRTGLCYCHNVLTLSLPGQSCRFRPGPFRPIGGGMRALRGRSANLHRRRTRILESLLSHRLRRLFSFLAAMRNPQLCATVRGRTMDELRRARDAADVRRPRRSAPRPRRPSRCDRRRSRAGGGRFSSPAVPSWEGGGFRGSRRGAATDSRRTPRTPAPSSSTSRRPRSSSPTITRRRRGRGIVLSSHAFGEPPRDLRDRATRDARPRAPRS